MRLHHLLGQALDVATGERQAFFEQIGLEDSGLIHEVRQLLDAEAELADLRLPTKAMDEVLGASEPSTREPAPAPERVGPYRIDGPLGRGGMGAVYRGFDQRLERPVALKHVAGSLEDEPVALERLRREAKAIARLNHPAIVQIYDWLESEQGCWFVMELIEGRTLKQEIDGRPLSIHGVIHVGNAVAGGLAAAHAAGILHRDLKVDNVMISHHGAVKLLDFGLAKSLRKEPQDLTLTGEGKILGTASAMSPEQASGEPLDERSDLFSLGILLYEAATGVSPFTGATTMHTLSNIFNHTQPPAIERNPEVPPELSKMIDQLLEKKPERRPATAREVSARLNRIFSRPSQPPAKALTIVNEALGRLGTAG